MGRADFFVRRKKRKKEKGVQPEAQSTSGPSFFFLFFLPDNSLAQSVGGPVPAQPQIAGRRELNEWPLLVC
jgi:hypothetical protein